MWARRQGGQSCACRVNISFWTHVKGLLKMCAGPCSPLAAPWKWQALRFSPLQDQVKSIKIYYSYGSAVTSLKAACNFRRERGRGVGGEGSGCELWLLKFSREYGDLVWEWKRRRKIKYLTVNCCRREHVRLLAGFSKDAIRFNTADGWMRNCVTRSFFSGWRGARSHVQHGASHCEENYPPHRQIAENYGDTWTGTSSSS